ncbi:Dolichol kinase [Aphelenchoides fujianensis]|nr:Dolichol kinase [Aphelenchoides fujianensis]
MLPAAFFRAADGADAFDFAPFGRVERPYERFDWTLVTSGWLLVVAFGNVLRARRRKASGREHSPPPFGASPLDAAASRSANLLLGAHVLAGLLLFAWRIDANPLAVPLVLLRRVFGTGGSVRPLLLLFWLLNVFATVGFCVRTAVHVPTVGTAHRKFFHATVSLVALSGFWWDAAFCVLCGHAVVQAFIVLEILRSNRVEPWATPLDRLLLPFLDAQDSAELVLTPIHLIGGVFLPTVLELAFGAADGAGVELPRFFVGIVAVGVGDSAAALVGSRLGRRPWGVGGRKTAEGSAAMFAAQLLAHALLFGRAAALRPAVWLVYAALTLLEAALERGDNVLLPAAGFFAFRLVDLLFGP